MLPIKLKYPTQVILYQKKDYELLEVITLRARVLKYREEDLKEVKLYLRRVREKNAKYYNTRPNIQYTLLQVGDLVLLYRVIEGIDISQSKKLAYKQ